MWKFILLFSFFTLMTSSYLHNFIAIISDPLHQFCIRSAPPSHQYRELYQAMVCGSNLEASALSSNMRQIGLYHLFVVSGSHFVFLEWLLWPLASRLGRPGQLLIFFLLSTLTLTCSLAPPVTRAWISFMLRKVNDETRLFWRGHHATFFSGLLTLFLFPEWASSYSFLLSWTASLLISLPIKESWLRHVVIYLGLLPVLCGIQTPHPVTSMINWLLAPLLGVALLPISLLAYMFNFLTPLFDLTWSGLETLLRVLAREIPPSPEPVVFSLALGWLYLAAFHFFVWHLTLLNEKKKIRGAIFDEHVNSLNI